MKKKNKNKHFFYDSMLSIVFFIIYLAVLIIISKVEDRGMGLIFFIALLSYCSSLVLPEYVDMKCNNKASKILMWLLRFMFLLGVIYAIYDITRPCGWFCFSGINGLLALVGLIIIPLVVMIVYGIVYWIIKRKKKRK